MSVKTILTEPNKLLRKISDPVEKVGDEEKLLMNDMLDTMYNANGIGLAATQIYEDKRLIVMDCGLANLEHDDMSEEEYNKNVESNKIEPCPLKMINPEIIYYSSNITEREEGCLSIPGYNAQVKRPESITVNYTDISKNNITLEANGLLSTCIQHEIDHLNGVLFIDHISRLKKEVILRKAIKEFTNDK